MTTKPIFNTLIADGATVLIDTNPIIYLLEGNPLAASFKPIFHDVDAGRIQAIVTPITLAEVVSGPLKNGNESLAERYRSVLTRGRGIQFVPIDDDLAMLAARLRVQHQLKLPDAFQLAAAIHHGCVALVTHDRDFSRVTDMRIVGVEASNKRIKK